MSFPVLRCRANRFVRFACALSLVVPLLGAGSLWAQEFPNRVIKLVVGYPPGGSNDIVARIIAPHLGEALGTTIVVENRAGANGIIGADFVAKSAPDGYTLLAASASPLVLTPHTLGKPPFDTTRDFAAINTVGLTPEAIAVGPSLSVKTLKELIELAKTKQINLASSGTGGLPHLTIELLRKTAPGKIVHVPFKGAGPAVTDTLAGHVDGIVMDLPPLYALIKDGRLRALAVTSENRVDFLPEIPTAHEALPGFSVVNWVGVLAPANTPKAVIDRINAAIVKVVAMPQVKEQLTKAAVVPSTLASPDAYQEFLAAEYARWGKAIKEAGVPMSN